MTRWSGRSATVALATLVAVLALLTGCGRDPEDPDAPPGIDPEQVDQVAVPKVGLCRQLTQDDIAAASNATETVSCSGKHTAETFAAGELPPELDDAAYDSPELGAFAYRTCNTGLQEFLGADESLAMRTVLSWAWFRPSEKAWDEGARWYRCDVVGGGEQSNGLIELPKMARGLLQGRPDDRWLACIDGPTVTDSVKVPCTDKHTWRAVTTIKLGEAKDPYPGDRLSEVRSRDFCKRSVQAFLNYPAQFDYGFTWFHEAEWAAGNRRSVCWAKTSE